MRFSLHALRVLGILNKTPGKQFSGSELSLKTNLPSGTIYPLLARYEKVGFIKSRWEKGDPSALKRPLKKFYKIAEEGRKRYLFETSRNP